MSYRAKRTIRIRIFDGDRLVHETVTNSKGLKVVRDMTDAEYRIEISPAPNWEEVGRWEELDRKLAQR